MIAVDQPSPTQSPKEQLETLQNSLSKIEKGVNRAGCQLIVPTVIDITQRNLNSAVFSTIPTYNWAIQASGGVICIDADFSVAAETNITLAISLFIDEKEVLTKRFNCPTTFIYTNMSFSHRSILTSGSHVISFKWKSTGAAYVNASASAYTASSNVSIMELSAP